MNLGKLFEMAEVDALFARPRHHYTRAVLSAIPVPDPAAPETRIALQGEVPSGSHRPPGCPFHPRCAAALPLCREVEPMLESDAGGHRLACHNAA
jgi:oligopeptide/dipeptide ABC transporter ATP-binding protein